MPSWLFLAWKKGGRHLSWAGVQLPGAFCLLRFGARVLQAACCALWAPYAAFCVPLECQCAGSAQTRVLRAGSNGGARPARTQNSQL